MKKSISFFSICLLLILSASLSAQTPDRWPWRSWRCYVSTLNLTTEQIRKFENLYQNFIKEINPIENNLISKSLELRTLLFKSLPDKSAIIVKKKEMSDLQQKLNEKILDYRLEALGILTTEQILLLPSDCCLGFNVGRGYRMGFSRGFGYGMGFGRDFGKGRFRGCGMGFYYGQGRGMRRNTGYYPYWQP